MKTKKTFVFTTAILMLAFVSPLAYGGDLEQSAEASESAPAPSDDWEFRVIPYVWAVGIDGTQTVKGNEMEIDASFGDIFDVMDFAGEVHLTAGKGKWELFLDPTYIKLSPEGDVGPLDVDVDFETWLVEFGAFYQLWQRPLGDGDGRFLSFDALVGGRYLYMDVDLDIEGGGPLGADLEVGGSEDWIDLIIGGRVSADLTEKFSVGVRGDIGGFGIEDSSDFTWNVMALLGYHISETMTLWAGYRHLDIDYDDGSGPDLFAMDVEMSGPIVGMEIRF
ncbi:MAG: porin family protein [Planctomycetota bacterium]